MHLVYKNPPFSFQGLLDGNRVQPRPALQSSQLSETSSAFKMFAWCLGASIDQDG